MIGIDEIVFVAQRKGKRSTDGGQHHSVEKAREGKGGKEIGEGERNVTHSFVLFNQST